MRVPQAKERPINWYHSNNGQNERGDLRQTPKATDEHAGNGIVFESLVDVLVVVYDSCEVDVRSCAEVEDVNGRIAVGEEIWDCCQEEEFPTESIFVVLSEKMSFSIHDQYVHIKCTMLIWVKVKESILSKWYNLTEDKR